MRKISMLVIFFSFSTLFAVLPNTFAEEILDALPPVFTESARWEYSFTATCPSDVLGYGGTLTDYMCINKATREVEVVSVWKPSYTGALHRVSPFEENHYEYIRAIAGGNVLNVDVYLHNVEKHKWFGFSGLNEKDAQALQNAEALIGKICPKVSTAEDSFLMTTLKKELPKE